MKWAAEFAAAMDASGIVKNEGGFEEVRPGYLRLFRTGELERRAVALETILEACELCPRRCGVNRKADRIGACGVGARPKIAAASIHPWEEPPISGTRGSGTLFFSGCTLRCLFCQNYPISQLGVGRELTVEALAEEMFRLQCRGAHNLNLVTPTHQVPAFVRALCLAVPKGFRLPIVYNTSGYERVEILRLLDGIVDVYLPDIKYADPAVSLALSGRADYVEANRRALKVMAEQVGPLQLDRQGIAFRGLMVRHMVLPEGLAGTGDCLEFIRSQLGPQTWVSLLHQYFPAHKALKRPPLDRKVTEKEYADALEILFSLGLPNGFVQEADGG
jgi:putative pyruvate formate lyase activating enzyme